MSAFPIRRDTAQISRDEWRLQWRSWGTWLVGLFLLAVVLSEHPFFSGTGDFSVALFAGIWADRVSIVGCLVAILTVPFALDRVRRQHVAPLEFTKPFEKSAYVLGKFVGAISPLLTLVTFSLIFHLSITLIASNTPLLISGMVYLEQALLTVFVPLFFITSLIFCMSVYFRRPILIIPISLMYLIMTTATQASADAKFSWYSAVIRPEYFDGIIPESMMPILLKHHAIYLGLSVTLVILSVIGFQRQRFIVEKSPANWLKRLHLPTFPFVSIRLRMFWNGYIVASLLIALVAVANTLSNPNPDFRVEYAFFGLEFYLSLSGLLILSGVLARDKTAKALDFVLTKPINRWRLLADRLLPALVLYGMISIVSVFILDALYEPLPILKSLLIALSTGIYLGTVGMTVANLTRNTLSGVGAGMIYWFFEAGSNGRITAPFYLLIVSHQLPAEIGDVWLNPVVWLPVKIGLLILSIFLFWVNGWLLDVGTKKRRAFTALLIGIPGVFAVGWWLIPALIG